MSHSVGDVNASAPAPGAARANHWFRHAIVHTLAGTLLGLLTAALVVVLSLKAFPELADFDYDMGLRMERFDDEHLDFAGTGMQPKPPSKERAGPDAYLFVDVDPAPERPHDLAVAAVGACAALQARHADRFALAAEASAPSPADHASGRTLLECGDARPVNRYLLAELVSDLKRRGAGLVILDVELGQANGDVPAAERAALDDVLGRPRGNSLPVLHVQPAEYDMQNEQSGGHFVRVDANAASGRPWTQPAVPAIALPEPGQPVRRYPRCFLSKDAKAAGLPSLPYLADALFNGKEVINNLCPPRVSPGGTEVYEPKRIHYTLPTMRSHQDSTGQGDDFRLWSTYRGVYNRCTVAGLFSADSECGGDAMVKGKVVVVGASNPARRDRHYTPLGDMAGAEVVINAMRSFALFPHERDKTFGQALQKKAWIVFVCMFVWFAFFCVKGLLKAPHGAALGVRMTRGLLVSIAFAVALSAVLLITFKVSYSSLSVLVGVLAIGVEQYVELVTKWVIHPFERVIAYVLRLPQEHA